MAQAIFTFQYVSINTQIYNEMQKGKTTLHSNMFLLIRFMSWFMLFYFHTLHSNMFLLILVT